MTPADVAENLMPNSITEDSETCLKNLIRSLEIAKKSAEDEEAKKKAEDEEARLNAEKDKQELTQEEVKVKANGILEENVKENGGITH
ncbi:hypothetical protein TSUD_275010 [Trifolium subterraneum]|uniref:AAA+ ATPase At3g28540-like C-terminal domain-containing protein n=1 Tax=Trifolium subterraneum TaxID=3900 RepID=A0A2Z6PA30_TRISU|nr:hypothetical protein TSUD_275010 [Trifolium subterraneum]